VFIDAIHTLNPERLCCIPYFLSSCASSTSTIQSQSLSTKSPTSAHRYPCVHSFHLCTLVLVDVSMSRTALLPHPMQYPRSKPKRQLLAYQDPFPSHSTDRCNHPFGSQFSEALLYLPRRMSSVTKPNLCCWQLLWLLAITQERRHRNPGERFLEH
jgi:hypothetical protein